MRYNIGPMKAKLPPEINVLREISSVLVCERNVRDILEKVLDILEDRMGMLRGTFTLLDGDEVSIEASRGLGEREKAHGHYRLGEGITGTVAKTGHAEVVPDIHKDRRFLNRTGARRDSGPSRASSTSTLSFSAHRIMPMDGFSPS